MKRLQLDFAASKRSQGWPWLVAGLAVLGVCWMQYEDSAKARSEAEAAYESRLRESGKKKPKMAASRENMEASKIQAQLSLRWGTLLNAIEAASRPNIALLDVNPDSSKGTVKLLLEAKNEDAMFAYVHLLSEQPGLTQVVLQSHELQVNHPQQPIRFNLNANWGQ